MVLAALAGCAGATPSVVPRDAGSHGIRTAEGPSGALARLALALAENIRPTGSRRLRVAITELTAIDGRPCSVGPQIAEELTTSLFRSGRFHVVERRHLERVLREQRMSESGLLDPESGARIRRLLGADALVTGTVLPTPTGWHVNARIVLVESAVVVSAATANLPALGWGSRLACGEPAGPGLLALEPPPTRLGDPVVPSAPPGQATGNQLEAPAVAHAGPAATPARGVGRPELAGVPTVSPIPVSLVLSLGATIGMRADADEAEPVGFNAALSLDVGLVRSAWASALLHGDVSSVEGEDIGHLAGGLRIRPIGAVARAERSSAIGQVYLDATVGYLIVDAPGFSNGVAASGALGVLVLFGGGSNWVGLGLSGRHVRDLRDELSFFAIAVEVLWEFPNDSTLGRLRRYASVSSRAPRGSQPERRRSASSPPRRSSAAFGERPSARRIQRVSGSGELGCYGCAGGKPGILTRCREARGSDLERATGPEVGT